MGTVFEPAFGGFPVMESYGSSSSAPFCSPVGFEAGLGQQEQWREEKLYSSDSCLSSETPELSSRPSSRNSSRPSSYYSSSQGSQRSSYNSPPAPDLYFGFNSSTVDYETQDLHAWSRSNYYSIPEYSSWPLEYAAVDYSSLPVYDSHFPPALANVSPAQFSLPPFETFQSAKLQTPSHSGYQSDLFEYPRYSHSVTMDSPSDWNSSELGPDDSISRRVSRREIHRKYRDIPPKPNRGKALKDLDMHLLTRSKERLEKCPIVTCDYHVKGFCRKYDKQRHTLTHFKGILICNFCPGRGTPAAKTFQRADVFKRHLVSVHGAEYTPAPSSRKTSSLQSTLYNMEAIGGHWLGRYGDCSNCSVIYDDPQSFYNHFDKCVINNFNQRHNPTQSNGKMVCSFCPGMGTAAAKIFQRTDVFKRHLVSVHGAEYNPALSSRKSSSQKSTCNSLESTTYHWPGCYGNCSNCSVIYDDAQSFYNHLDECVISSVLRQASMSSVNTAKVGDSSNRAFSKDHPEKSQGSDALHHANKPRAVTKKPEVINEGEETGRKRRSDYPPSWGAPIGQMKMKKRVMCAFDGSWRLWKDEMLLASDFEATNFEAKMPWDNMESYADALDGIRMVQTEVHLNQTFQEEDRSRACIGAPKGESDGSSFGAKRVREKVPSIDQALTNWGMGPGKQDIPFINTSALGEGRVFAAIGSKCEMPNGTGWLEMFKQKGSKKPTYSASDTVVSAGDYAAPQRRGVIAFRNGPLPPERVQEAVKMRAEAACARSVTFKKETSEPDIKKDADLTLSRYPDVKASTTGTPRNDFDSFAPSPETDISEDVSDNESISDCSTDWGDDQKTTTPGSEVYRVLADSCDNHVEGEKNLLRPVLSPMKQALVDRIMDEFWTIVNQEWAANLTKCTGETPASSSPPGSNGSLIGGSSPRMANKKRQRDDGDEPPPDDNNGRTPKRPSSQPERMPPKNGVKFACPYRKHAPHRYTIYKHRSCALSHWDTVARVKEHLYRRHRVPIQCKRCWQTFKVQEALDAHLTVVNICSLQTGQATEGLTADLEKKLKSRKKSSPDQTEEARWKEIYGLLFPNEVVPNPYFEPVQENGPQSPDSRELADYEEYSRQELPRYFRSYLEDAVNNETQHLEEHMRSQLVSIVQDCQAQIYLAYKSKIANKDSKPIPESTVIDSCVTPPASQVSAEDSAEHIKTEPKNIVASAFRAPPPTPQSTLKYVPDLRDTQSRDVPAKTPDNISFSDSAYSSNGTASSQSIPTLSQTREFVQTKHAGDLLGQFPIIGGRTACEDLQDFNFDEAYNIPFDLNDPAFDSWWKNLEPES